MGKFGVWLIGVAALLALLVGMCLWSLDSHTWSPTTCHVDTSEVGLGQDQIVWKATYRYRFGGVAYNGQDEFESGEAEAVRDLYPPESDVECMVNPAAPSQSYLRQSYLGSKMTIALSVVLTLLALVGWRGLGLGRQDLTVERPKKALVLGVCLILLACLHPWQWWNFLRSPRFPILGRVLSITEGRGSHFYEAKVYVEYQAAGRRRLACLTLAEPFGGVFHDRQEALRGQDKAPLWLSPVYPNHPSLSELTGEDWLLLGWAAGPAIFLCLGGLLFQKKKAGVLVTAVITLGLAGWVLKQYGPVCFYSWEKGYWDGWAVVDLLAATAIFGLAAGRLLTCKRWH